MRFHRSLLPSLAMAALSGATAATFVAARADPTEPAQEEEATGTAADAPFELPPVYYAAILRPGPNWAKDVPPGEQVGVEVHLDHLVRHFQSGQLVMAGPFLDQKGSLVILEADDLEAAIEIAKADPSIEAGLLTLEAVHPWMVPLTSLVPLESPEEDEGEDDRDEDSADHSKDRPSR